MGEKTQEIRTVTANVDQKVFVIPVGDDRWTAFGFDNCFKACTQLAEMMKQPLPDAEQIGIIEQYNEYQDLLFKYSASTISKNTWFDPGTVPEVRRILDEARVVGTKLRLWYGNVETGLSWLDEWDIIGRIGRSMGPMRCPILLRTENSNGGGAILTACIIRIMNTATRRDLYKHPKFHNPKFILTKGQDEKYPFEVSTERDGVIARFETEKKRVYWLDFMDGKRLVH